MSSRRSRIAKGNKILTRGEKATDMSLAKALSSVVVDNSLDHIHSLGVWDLNSYKQLIMKVIQDSQITPAAMFKVFQIAMIQSNLARIDKGFRLEKPNQNPSVLEAQNWINQYMVQTIGELQEGKLPIVKFLPTMASIAAMVHMKMGKNASDLILMIWASSINWDDSLQESNKKAVKIEWDSWGKGGKKDSKGNELKFQETFYQNQIDDKEPLIAPDGSAFPYGEGETSYSLEQLELYQEVWTYHNEDPRNAKIIINVTAPTGGNPDGTESEDESETASSSSGSDGGGGGDPSPPGGAGGAEEESEEEEDETEREKRLKKEKKEEKKKKKRKEERRKEEKELAKQKKKAKEKEEKKKKKLEKDKQKKKEEEDEEEESEDDFKGWGSGGGSDSSSGSESGEEESKIEKEEEEDEEEEEEEEEKEKLREKEKERMKKRMEEMREREKELARKADEYEKRMKERENVEKEKKEKKEKMEVKRMEELRKTYEKEKERTEKEEQLKEEEEFKFEDVPPRGQGGGHLKESEPGVLDGELRDPDLKKQGPFEGKVLEKNQAAAEESSVIMALEKLKRDERKAMQEITDSLKDADWGNLLISEIAMKKSEGKEFGYHKEFEKLALVYKRIVNKRNYSATDEATMEELRKKMTVVKQLSHMKTKKFVNSNSYYDDKKPKLTSFFLSVSELSRRKTKAETLHANLKKNKTRSVTQEILSKSLKEEIDHLNSL